MRNVTLIPFKSNSNSFNDKKFSSYSINYPVNHLKKEKSNVNAKFYLSDKFENLFPTDKSSNNFSSEPKIKQFDLNMRNFSNFNVKNNSYEEKTIKENYKMVIPAIDIPLSVEDKLDKNLIPNILKVLRKVEYSYYSLSDFGIRVLFNSFSNCLNVFYYLDEYFLNIDLNINIKLSSQEEIKKFNPNFDSHFNSIIEQSKKNNFFETLQRKKIIELNNIILKNNLSDKYIYNLNHSIIKYLAMFYIQIEIHEYYFLFDFLLEILSLSNEFLSDLITIKIIGKNIDKLPSKYRIDKNQKLSIRVSSINSILFNEICDIISSKLKCLYEDFKSFILFNNSKNKQDVFLPLSLCVKYDKFPCL